MLQASVIFFAFSILGILFGAFNLAGISFELGRVILLAFLALAIVSFVGSLARKVRSSDI